MLRPVSSGERAYISAGCALGIRCDGRGPDDYRPISIENNVFPQSNGSSRVKLSDTVDVLCSVKADITEPDPLKPNQGKIDVNVDVSPSCRYTLDDRTLSAVGQRIADTLKASLMGSGGVSCEQLCIIEGKYCWQLFVDLTVVRMDGDPTDVCGLAAFAALHCTQLPRLQLKVGKQGTFDDFDVSPDMADNVPLPLNDLPILVSLHKVGATMMVDCDNDEQQCSDSAICLAINEKGEVCSSTFVKSGALKPNDLSSALQRGIAAAASIFRQVKEFLRVMGQKAAEEARFPDLSVNRLGLMV